MPLQILMQVQSLQPQKGNSLRKSTSYGVHIVKIGSPVFCMAHSFTNPPKNPMLYNAFQQARHPAANDDDDVNGLYVNHNSL